MLLAEPRRRPLPAIPAGRIAAPVLGVTGEAAEDVLGEEPGATVEVGEVQPGRPPVATLPAAAGAGRAGRAGRVGAAADESPSATALSPFSSHGPAAGGGIVPGVAAPGAALTAVPGNAAAVVGGSAIAAARVAVEAARLVRERPGATPRELRAALIGAAEPDPRLPARGAGAGALRRAAAGRRRQRPHEARRPRRPVRRHAHVRPRRPDQPRRRRAVARARPAARRRHQRRRSPASA